MGDNRPMFTFPNGDCLPWPRLFDLAEFEFEGNNRVFEDGKVVAAYDGTTRTGAIWCDLPQPHWTLLQPCLRDDFFDRLVADFVAHRRAAME